MRQQAKTKHQTCRYLSLMEVTHLLVLLLYTIMDVFLRDEYVLRPAAPIVLSSGDVQDPVKVFTSSLPNADLCSALYCSSTSETFTLIINALSPVCTRGDRPSEAVGSFPVQQQQANYRANSKRSEKLPSNDPNSGLLHSVNNALLGLKVLYEAHEAGRRRGIFRRVQQLVARRFGSLKLMIAFIKC